MSLGSGNVLLAEFQNQIGDEIKKKSWEAYIITFNQIVFLIIWLKNIAYILYMEEQMTKFLKDTGVDVSQKKGPVPDILSYEQAVRLTLDVAAQLSRLHEKRMGFISIRKEDIKMIGTNNFVISTPELFRVSWKNELLISKPFEYNELMAPELKSIKTLPSTVNANVGYYSICKLVLSLLNIDNNLARLSPTKLYYLMERIFKDDPDERRFIYI